MLKIAVGECGVFMKDLYQVQELMAQTRRLAVEFREKTGKVLPVGHELARYDVARLFGFSIPVVPMASVDFIGVGLWEGCHIQVKSRVLFKTNTSQRLGQLNFEAPWDTVFLLLFNPLYEPVEVYAANRALLKATVELHQQSSKHPMTINKFKSLATLAWERAEAEPLWQNY